MVRYVQRMISIPAHPAADTIFNRFRNAIKASKELIKEAEARGGAPPARSKTSNSNPATPRRGLAATISASKKRSQPSDDDEPESPTKKAKKSRGKTAKSVEKEVEKDEPVVEEPVVEEESVVKEEMIDEEDIDAEDKVEVEA